ncbi:unknown [Prevotella sp. CAG:1185]|nr:unknown [Prevotella sp. CAG:1185]
MAHFYYSHITERITKILSPPCSSPLFTIFAYTLPRHDTDGNMAHNLKENQ